MSAPSPLRMAPGPVRARALAAALLAGVPGGSTAQAPPASCGEAAAVRVVRDIEYARPGDRALRLDLYLAAAPTIRAPLVVLVPGGRRSEGRADHACLAAALAGLGLGAAVIEYRGPHERRYPAALEDVRAAVRWLRANAAAHGFGPGPIGLAGRDFGGYLAALAALTAVDAHADTRVDAVATLNAPMDLRGWTPPPDGYPYLHALFLGYPPAQDPELWRAASPVTHVGPDAPRFAMLYGAEQRRVPVAQAEAMRQALEAAGGVARVRTLPGTAARLFDDTASAADAARQLGRFFGGAVWLDDPAFELRRDVVYASPGGRDLRLDLFLPRAAARPAPAVLLLHGGGWLWGSKRDVWPEAAELARHGFAAAAVEYRLARERIYPAAIDDAKAAVRWLRANAAGLGVDPGRIGVTGVSAGGHIAALLGVTPDRPFLGEAFGPLDVSAAVQAVAPIAGVVDMAAQDARDNYGPAIFLGASLLENPERFAEASPIRHVSRDAAPFLFLHGTEDDLVSHAEAVAMAQRLRAAGAAADVYSAEGGDHDFLYNAPWREPALRALIAFFRRALRAQP